MSERSELANSIDTTDHIGGDPANNEDANRRQIRPRPPEPSILSKSTNDLTDGQSDNNTEDNYDKLDLDRRSTPYKSQEQLEMGVNNYGYMKTMSERGGGSSGGTPNDEWESTLSVFNPYTIETNQLRHPSVGVEMQETAPQDDTNRLSTNSKRSDYSSIPENNYTSPQDMGPQYEDLAAMQNNLRAKFAPNGTSKKANMIYEPASIKKVDKRKKSSASMVSGFEDNSNYCHLVFTFLVAVLAVIALVMVFMLLFGVLSAKSCKECQSGQAGAMSGGIIDDTNTDLQLAYIKGNLTLLQNLLHSNTTKKITNLQNELDVQTKLVSDLRTELTRQKRLTSSLSADVLNLTSPDQSHLRGPAGLQGPPGFNGTIGPPGTRGVGPDFSTCTVKNVTYRKTITPAEVLQPAYVLANIDTGKIAVNIFCSSESARAKDVTFKQDYYQCVCKDFQKGDQSDCTIHMFLCDM